MPYVSSITLNQTVLLSLKFKVMIRGIELVQPLDTQFIKFEAVFFFVIFGPVDLTREADLCNVIRPDVLSYLLQIKSSAITWNN